LRHVLRFQPRRAKYHAKRVRRCRSTNSGRLMTLLDLSPADFRRFLKSGVLKKLFILSQHGTKANIRSTKMANNRHAYNRDVLQSYWTSDGLPLYCSQPTGEKTHKPTMCDFRRFLTVLVDRRLLGSQCCLSTGLVANGIRLTKRCNALSSRSGNRLKSAGRKSRRVIKRPLLVDRH
jgi:hypothetical protein